MFATAIPVTCPIIVLNAKETIVAIETPLDRVRVSNTSAGIIQDRGPHVAEKEKLYTQVMMMKPHPAALFWLVPGGNTAIRIVAIMKVTMLPRLPSIKGQRRPNRSINKRHKN